MVLLILMVIPFVAHGHLLFPQTLQALVVDLDLVTKANKGR